MALSNNANIGFEKQIWDAACVLWDTFQQQNTERLS